MDPLLFLLDGIIIASSLAAGAMPFVVLAMFLHQDLTQATRLKERRRRYREQLRRSLNTVQDLTASREADGRGLTEEASGRDLRRDPRKRVFLGARVRLDSSESALDCTVVDLSSSGARLAFGGVIAFSAGAEVVLQLRGDDKPVHARVAWSRANQCGIRFSEPEAIKPAMANSSEQAQQAA